MNLKTCFLLAFLVCLSLGLSACNTINGIGQDLRNAGSSISNAANR